MKKVIMLLVAGAAVMFFINAQEPHDTDTSIAKTKERIWQASQMKKT